MLSLAKPPNEGKNDQQNNLKPGHGTPEALYASMAILLMCKPASSYQVDFSQLKTIVSL